MWIQCTDDQLKLFSQRETLLDFAAGNSEKAIILQLIPDLQNRELREK